MIRERLSGIVQGADDNGGNAAGPSIESVRRGLHRRLLGDRLLGHSLLRSRLGGRGLLGSRLLGGRLDGLLDGLGGLLRGFLHCHERRVLLIPL